MTLFRPALVDDAQAIREVGMATWWATYSPYVAASAIAAVMRSPWSVDNIRRQITNVTQQVLVAEVEGEIVGVLFGSANVRDNDAAFIERWYVRPDMQGKKLGIGLWHKYCERLPAEVEAVELDVFVENHPALRFYERLGFAEVRRFDDQIAGHTFSLLYLRRTL
jgi:ribosomal protein S18 acetylase RimI-like enzyme